LIFYFDFHPDADVLVVNIQNVSEGGQSHLRIRLQCQSMDLAAELVQDLTRYFKLEELESEADFPAELQAFEEVKHRNWVISPVRARSVTIFGGMCGDVQVVGKVADCNAARVSLAADMADDSQRIKVTPSCVLREILFFPDAV
jgi:hypothetical protein